MNQIISALSGEEQFTVGFMDSRRSHFGAYNKGMLPPEAAAYIATSGRATWADANFRGVDGFR